VHLSFSLSVLQSSLKKAKKMQHLAAHGKLSELQAVGRFLPLSAADVLCMTQLT